MFIQFNTFYNFTNVNILNRFSIENIHFCPKDLKKISKIRRMEIFLNDFLYISFVRTIKTPKKSLKRQKWIKELKYESFHYNYRYFNDLSKNCYSMNEVIKVKQIFKNNFLIKNLHQFKENGY